VKNNFVQNEFYFQWHITERCNLRCAHCYQNNYSTPELSLSDLRKIADKIIKTLTKWNKKGRISITGGEPLIKKELIPLLEYLNKSDHVAHLDVLSNGTLLNESITEKLRNIPKLRRVQVSLDGASPATHDFIRGEGAFEKAIAGIRMLKEHGIKVNVMFTLQRNNARDISALFDLMIAEGINGLTIERIIPCGSGSGLKESLLSSDETRKVFQEVSDRADLEYKKGTPLVVLKYRTLWANIDPARSGMYANTPPEMDLGAVCSVGIDSLCILPDATVLPCRRLNIPIGNLRNDSIFKIWYSSDVLWKIRNKENLKGKCHDCELIPRCSGCRAMAYAVTGDFLEEDPQCWKTGNLRYGELLKDMCSTN